MLYNLQNKKIILGSASPRRQQLLKEIIPQFEIRIKDCDERFPPYLKAEQIGLFLALEKAKAFEKELQPNELLITADTIVWLNRRVLNKPADRDEAISMLKTLSGKKHEVFTGVCISSVEIKKPFYAKTDVYFKELTEEEIIFYVDNYHPFDKAGSYGAQDWIGMTAIARIDGGYFNVMGLPMQELYEELSKF